ncbi:hypothetical protein ABQZ99_007335 [Xanthomonas hortorum pv. vitians]|uniref:Lipoprotein n=2 Tax=Xanthomonas hortorum TaxID=56454 RepID=A0A6V7EUS7_9XANT|nr:hypothetical protein [Xanthomonas hortorum]MCC4624891.1 hypothetical protein [Xanthomonas campestris pv. nigromaculans]APP81344.1 hypothetical protein BJD10_18005 [Xanthomonas hortorum pv. gardneri]APP85509.1 hypothetical protein BI317_16335 [Xanthomonas hortorum pv. gardneri]ASW44629.1 hypothetical protein XJ27_00590 [Xanthomonas hortorum]EGD19517.1 hypothetical protein XGA_1845 [Xanthomonas hortorum ATCC 19865]
MKTTFVLSVILASFGACGITQAAQYMDAQALRAAATGERFKSGPDTYRMLPGTVVSDPLPAELADSAAAPAAKTRATPIAARPTGKVAARIGPYAVVLDTPAGAARSASPSISSAERTMAAAVNERNGRVVLVRPQLKLIGTTPTNAVLLARNSGGSIVYTSAVDDSAVIAYSSVEKAQQALARLQTNSGGAQLSLVVAQSIMQPM